MYIMYVWGHWVVARAGFHVKSVTTAIFYPSKHEMSVSQQV